MAKFFIERPIFAIVIAIIISTVGLISLFNLPVAQYPQITPPQTFVMASYVGANAEVVEQTIAQLVEQQVNGVERMISMTSTSADNGSYLLQVQFELGTNADIDTVETENRVNQANASLPESVRNSGITTRKRSSDLAMVFALYSPNGSYDNVFLKNYGSIHLVDDLKRVKGVGDVMEYGADFGMRVWLRPDKMAQLGITATDVYNAINDQNIQAPAGVIGSQPSVPEQQFQYTVRVQGRLKQPEEFEKIVIRSNTDGSQVRLGDIARVELGGRNYSYSGLVNNQHASTIAIQLNTDANVLETVTGCKKVLAEAAKHFPTDMDYKIVVDTTQFVQESMKEVALTFVESILLVMLIVFLFLQSGRSTMIPMLAVPVSLLGAFASFWALGFTINTLTLFAMVLAIGLVVDDAIVVIEAVEHHMRYSGLSPHDATARAMSEVSGPVVAIAFVLAAVFIPVAFFGGTVGVLYKQFALTVAVAMGLSALVALTLTPALCALLLKPYDPDAHSGLLAKIFDRFNDWFERTVESYGRGVQKVIRRAPLCVVLLLVIVVLIGGLYKLVPSSFVPAEDQGYYITTINLPEASSLNRTMETAAQVGQIISTQPGVQDVMAVGGLDFLQMANKPSAAAVFTRLNPWDERQTPATQVRQEIISTLMAGSHIPEATVLSFNVPSIPGLGTTGGFSMMLESREGASDEEIDRIAKQFLAAARQRPEIGTIYANFNINTPGYKYVVDREKAKTLGVPVDDVYSALQTFFGGGEVNDFNEFGHSYKVVMQAEPEFRTKAEDIRYFFVRSSSGQMIPLNTLVTAQPTSGPTVIQRFNGFRAVKVGGETAPGYSSGQSIQALEEVAAQTLPLSFSYEWTDLSREEKISGSQAPVLFGLGLFLVFLCLAALYESWSIPLVVLFCVPTGVFGAFLLQYLRNLENNIYMQIGLLVLIGLAAKNAILIVQFAKVRVDNGEEPAAAAIEAAKLRLRPILMTSLAFIIGCLPLAISTGAGSAARRAMGNAVVGGMLMATAIGIFLIPVLFVIIERLTEKIRRPKKPARGLPAPAAK